MNIEVLNAPLLENFDQSRREQRREGRCARLASGKALEIRYAAAREGAFELVPNLFERALDPRACPFDQRAGFRPHPSRLLRLLFADATTRRRSRPRQLMSG